MMIPFDRPVTWREYVAGGREDPENIFRECAALNADPPSLEEILDVVLDRHEAILTATAAAIGIPISEVAIAATTGRIRWMAEFTPSRTEPVRASLDGGEWLQIAGVANCAPDKFEIPPQAAQESREIAA